ncbi:MAG TPA: methylated-DNA--[protein]-cysteine S-methyltransferase [Candidatus Limnocylindrales bacterium]|nr:methylated-DNA--[protein]-cysteine S-methyltransferase [Candidatus Limnocylindrales bacterium]
MARTTPPNQTGGAALARRTMSTPIGPLELVAGPAGLRAVLWPGEDGSRVARAVGPAGRRAGDSPARAGGEGTEVASAVRGAAAPEVAGAGAGWDPADLLRAEEHLDAAQAQLEEYFAGSRREFDLALDPAGTDFQLRAWTALRTIPYGTTVSYGEQAAEIGEPGAARAVGAANGRNPLSIVVPCHRVVAASGALTGFAGGLGTKAWLLDHERAVLAGG